MIKVRCMDLPDSDWGDLSCRRAVDSSSFKCIIETILITLTQWQCNVLQMTTILILFVLFSSQLWQKWTGKRPLIIHPCSCQAAMSPGNWAPQRGNRSLLISLSALIYSPDDTTGLGWWATICHSFLQRLRKEALNLGLGYMITST